MADVDDVLDRLAQRLTDPPQGLLVERTTTGRLGLQVTNLKKANQTATVVAVWDQPGGWRYRWGDDNEFIGMAGEVELVARLVRQAVTQ